MSAPLALTLEDVLHDKVAASVLIASLDLRAKRNLRLACHAYRDAVDSTVTFLCMPGVGGKFKSKFKIKSSSKERIKYASILYNSNSWNYIKSIDYSLTQKALYGQYVEPLGLTQIAEAGLSKLESLTLRLLDLGGKKITKKDKFSSSNLVKARWKLKKLEIRGYNLPSKWLRNLMKAANWPLEELIIDQCTESISKHISVSNWKLRTLFLLGSSRTLSPEDIETLMRGSWVRTVERLYLSFSRDKEKKGTRAISKASRRAAKLLDLEIITSGFDNQNALILGEGSYPCLKLLRTGLLIHVSGIAAILRKCPKLEVFEHTTRNSNGGSLYRVDDPEDAKLVAEYYKNGIIKANGCRKGLLKDFLTAYL